MVQVTERLEYFPTPRLQRYRQHVHHNEQVAQQVDVFWNLFQVFSDLSLNGVTDCQMRRPRRAELQASRHAHSMRCMVIFSAAL